MSPTQHTPKPLRIVSHGGGVQTTALLVLAAQGQVDFDTFVMANVGDDSEAPETLAYLHDVAIPYAKANKIDLVEVSRRRRNGSAFPTLLTYLENPEIRSVPIPVYMANGAPGTRQCTERWKIKVVGRWATEHGATPDNPATVAIGFSADEVGRANANRSEPWERKVFPLIDMGITRRECHSIIANAGLPPAPKSSCWFCPYRSAESRRQEARNEPERFARSLELEDNINAQRGLMGRDRAWLSSKGPLATVASADQGAFDLDGPDSCDTGYCFT